MRQTQTPEILTISPDPMDDPFTIVLQSNLLCCSHPARGHGAPQVLPVSARAHTPEGGMCGTVEGEPWRRVHVL